MLLQRRLLLLWIAQKLISKVLKSRFVKYLFLVSSTRGYSFKSAVKFIKLTYQQHGFLALYRGNAATMARVMPYAALQFAAFEQYRRLLKVDDKGYVLSFIS